MRLILKRSGGFAGILPPPLTLDTNSLRPAAARSIERLIASCDFFNLPPELAAPSPQPDRFQFTLTVTHEDGREHTVKCDEEAADKSFLELIRLVQRTSEK